MKKRLIFILVLSLAIFALAFAPLNRERVDWLIAKKLTVQGGGANFQSAVDMDSTLNVDGAATFAAMDFSGGVDLNGQSLDMDADDDTSLTADTDDQIDVEIGGADLFVLKDWGSSTITTDTTEYLFEILDTTNVMTAGTNELVALNIDLGIGNSTAGTNVVNGIKIDGISQDAQNTETAIVIGNGWDRGIDLDGNSLYLDNDQDSIIAEVSDDLITLTPGAATGSFEVRTGNLQVGNGTPDQTHDGEDFYVEGITELDGAVYVDGAATFTSTTDFYGGVDLNGQQLDLDADDDTSLTADTDDQVDVEIGGADVMVLKDWGASTITTDTTKYLFEIFDTTNVMTAGTNVLAALNIDLGIGNSTAGTNSIYGILVDAITGDAQNTETAISIGSGWDHGLDAGTNTIINIGAAGTDFGSDGSLTTALTVTITSGGLTVTAGGVDIQSGDLTLANDETIGNSTDGLINFGGGLIYNSTSITVTDGETITPTAYTGYRLNAASEVTITLAACSSDFQPLFLYGEDAQTINVNDTNVRTSDGNAIAFDQYDVVEWQCVNSEWNLVYEANNQ